MVPSARVDTSHGTVLIASSHKITTEDFPDGCYRTMWVVDRGGLDIASDLYFEANHDIGMIDEDRFRARIAATLKSATAWLSLNQESGRYAN